MLPLPEEIAKKLRQSRLNQKLSIDDFAQKIALSPSQIRALESGDLRPFYSRLYFDQAAIRYAQFLSIKIDDETGNQPDASQPILSQPTTPSAINQEDETATITDSSSTLSKLEARNKRALWHSHRFNISQRKKLLALSASAVFTIFGLLLWIDSSPFVGDRKTSISESQPATPVHSSEARETKDEAAQKNEQLKGAVLRFTDSTWVQLVSKTGEKQNLRVSPSQPVEFSPDSTAAIAFGKPSKAQLTVRGREIDLTPYIQPVTPPRALVIISSLL